MSLVDIFPYLTGAGGAVIVLVLGYYLIFAGHLVVGRSHREEISAKDAVITDKDRQIELLTRANDHERSRGEAAVEAARASRDLLVGLQAQAALRQLPPP
jgi:hypothetical protein